MKGDGNCGLYSLLASLKIIRDLHLGMRQVICDELMNNVDNERINLGFTGINGPTDRTSYINGMRQDGEYLSLIELVAFSTLTSIRN